MLKKGPVPSMEGRRCTGTRVQYGSGKDIDRCTVKEEAERLKVVEVLWLGGRAGYPGTVPNPQ